MTSLNAVNCCLRQWLWLSWSPLAINFEQERTSGVILGACTKHVFHCFILAVWVVLVCFVFCSNLFSFLVSGIVCVCPLSLHWTSKHGNQKPFPRAHFWVRKLSRLLETAGGASRVSVMWLQPTRPTTFKMPDILVSQHCTAACFNDVCVSAALRLEWIRRHHTGDRDLQELRSSSCRQWIEVYPLRGRRVLGNSKDYEFEPSYFTLYARIQGKRKLLAMSIL